MGRGRRDTSQLTCRVDNETLRELRSVNPSLFTKTPDSDKVKFRHGALGRYVTRLIAEDIANRKNLAADELIQRFLHD